MSDEHPVMTESELNRKFKPGDRVVTQDRYFLQRGYLIGYEIEDPIGLIEKYPFPEYNDYVTVIFTSKNGSAVPLAFWENELMAAPSPTAWYALPMFSDPY